MECLQAKFWSERMNERIKALAEQASLTSMWVVVNEPTGSQVIKPIDEQIIERFAELVRQDEANGMRETYMKMIHGAIAEEREACALLVEAGNFLYDEAPDAKWAEVICKWIRARGEK